MLKKSWRRSVKEQEHINHKLIAQPLIAHSQPQGRPKAAPNPDQQREKAP
jgi:hypothetical protein